MEYLDIFSKFGEPTGETIDRNIAHEKGMFHKSIHVWIVNSKGELLVQRRNANKKTYPNMLDTSFAGHVSSGESLTEAILREGKEELGLEIDLNCLNYLFAIKSEKQVRENYYENEINDVYLYEKDVKIGECKFTDDEVSEIKYIDFKILEKMWKEKSTELIDHDVHYAALFYLLHQKFDK